MADKNIPTDQETTPETQVESIADKTRKWKFEQIANTVVLLTGLTLSVNSAQAWELPKWYEKDTQAGKELSMQDTTKKPELANKVIDTKVEKEMLDLYTTKKWWNEVIKDYESLQSKDKVKVLEYYKNLDWKHLKAVTGRIMVFKNIELWLNFVSVFDKTNEVWEMPDSIKSWFDFWLDFDSEWKSLFTENELEFFKVIDKTVLWIKQANIAKTEENILKMQKQIKFLQELNKKLSSIN